MNKAVPPPNVPPPTPEKGPPPMPVISGRDREFLPAALEILETPPAPAPVALMLTLCAFVVIALAWAFFGRLDIHAVAQGKIETTGRSKTVQPLEAGKVLALKVENGAAVSTGDLLLTLDSSEAAADEKAFSDAALATRAEALRRQASIARARLWPSQTLLPAPQIDFDGDTPSDSRNREQAVLIADLTQLQDALANVEKQIAQKMATRQRLEMSIAYQTTLITTLKDRVGVRQESLKREVGTKINLFDALESLDKSRASLASDQGQLIETEAAIAELHSQKAKLQSQFIADNTGKLADAERKLSDTVQQLAKARAKLARTALYAPISGTVQQLAVTTLGQVVTPGQQLMMIVPKDGELQVEVYMSNADIGFVKLGQEAAIKLDAFPFTRYGTLHGKVIRIAREAIDEQEAKRLLASATGQSSGSGAPAGQPPSFVFPVTLSLDERAMKIDDVIIPLTPGMTLNAEIKTDSRRVIDYLFSPLSKVASEALKER